MNPTDARQDDMRNEQAKRIARETRQERPVLPPDEYQRRQWQVMSEYCTVVTCRYCGSPRIEPYVCTFCKDQEG